MVLVGRVRPIPATTPAVLKVPPGRLVGAIRAAKEEQVPEELGVAREAIVVIATVFVPAGGSSWVLPEEGAEPGAVAVPAARGGSRAVPPLA